MIKFIRCQLTEILDKVVAHYTSKDILVDSFWEDQIEESTCYHILYGDKLIGYCAVQQLSTLTLFYVDKSFSYLAQDIFAKAKRLEEVNEALIPTGDELFLSLAMDQFQAIEKQAYFTHQGEKREQEPSDLVLQLATLEDKDIVVQYSEGFFGDILAFLKQERIYIAKKEKEIVGFGVIEWGRIRKDLASTGMFVRREYRCKGIGTQILKALRNVVNIKGKVAISGCWYYNHNSIKTQLKAGNYCSTRLLRIKF